MTLSEIKALLMDAIPTETVTHYFSTATTKDYTYWEETRRLPLTADDGHDEAWRFYVHRYTKRENDPVAARLYAALDADPRVAVAWTTDYDPASGYIHHIFECEGY